MDKDILLNVKELHTGFESPKGFILAVTGVSFDIARGESVALVGESGCGKSVTAMSVMQLLSVPPARIEAEEIKYNGQDLMKFSAGKMREIRGNEISMIFQEPMTSLNPILKIGFQIAESLRIHRGLNKKEAWDEAVNMLRKVGIPDPEKRVNEYPHQLSGGMRQRVMIAIALSCRPNLLIADEPTTALDVTIQAQILELIADLQEETGMSLLLITHNMGIVAQMADRVMVVYAGQIVESTDVDTIFDNPAHPYTIGLLESIPSADEKVKTLNITEGTVPSPMFYPKGCRFAPRCPYADEKCAAVQPSLSNIGNGHLCRCHYPKNTKGGGQL